MELFRGLQGEWTIFQDVYHLAVDEWMVALISPRLVVRDPLFHEDLDLSLTSYADDVAKGKLFTHGHDLQQQVQAEDRRLSDALQHICTGAKRGQTGAHGQYAILDDDDDDVVVDDDDERHHGLKSWDEHGTKGAGQAANATSRKTKKERHHTYATFLFRNVREVSRLTGKSNVTKEVYESNMTSRTARKKDDWAQYTHFSEGVKQEVGLHDMVCTIYRVQV